MFLPSVCVVCGRSGPAVCPTCASAFQRAPAGPPPAGLDACISLVRYEGTGRDLVLALKYRNRRSVIPLLAVALAQTVARLAALVDVVTWAPTSAARRHERGYDQARLLAIALAGELRCRSGRLLRRTSAQVQTGLDAPHRRDGPTFVPIRGSPPSVLLVDDVVTTGATLSAAATTLRHAGARRVIGVTVARTPLKVPP